MKNKLLVTSFLVFGIIAHHRACGLDAPPGDLQTNLILRAQSGHAGAQASLASIYWYNAHPGGAEKSPDAIEFKQSAYWATKAAEQNERNAQLLLGDLYRRGLGLQKSETLARHWYFLAASNQNNVACLRMADLYATDVSSDSNRIESFAWLLLATNEVNHRIERLEKLRQLRSKLGSKDSNVATNRSIELLRLFRERKRL